jgi:hypothetical protein
VSSQSHAHVNERRALFVSAALRPATQCSFVRVARSATPTSAHMAFEKGVMEIADSDEEPVTSSPSAAPADAADKLHAMASAPPQEPQDAAQDAHCAHQALGQADANTTGQSTAGLGLSRDDASIDLDTSSADHTDVKPDGALLPQEEGAMSVLMSQDFAPRTLDASVANSSTGQLASSAAPALCDTLAREYACPKLAEDVVDTYQPQAHELQTRTVQDHVVADGSSQSRLKDGVQEAGQDAGTIHPSENAVCSRPTCLLLPSLT